MRCGSPVPPDSHPYHMGRCFRLLVPATAASLSAGSAPRQRCAVLNRGMLKVLFDDGRHHIEEQGMRGAALRPGRPQACIQ